MPETRAQLNRKVRQEALREQLKSQGHIQHVVEIVDKLRDPTCDIEADMVQRYKYAVDTKLKLINKYLPDIKAVEVEGNINHTAHEDWLDMLNDQ
jgi:hypothetical protein